MRQRTRTISLLTLALLLTITPAAAPPAAADHGNSPAHWRSGVYPVVTTTWCAGNACELIQDAAYYWQNRGFSRGYTPPLPRTGHDCNPAWNEIVICFVPWGSPQLRGRGGMTYSGVYDWDQGHLGWAQIFVCGDCSNWDRQALTRHEMGHALGLGHTGDWSCVMHDPVVVLGETCWHDAWQLAAIHNHWD